VPDAPPPASSRIPPELRFIAVIEVILCSDFPTQLALAATFSAFGYRPFGPGGQLQVGYIVGLSLADSLLLISFVLIFLYAHGEKPREVLLNRQPIAEEIRIGIPMIFVALAIAFSALILIRIAAPWLHTVPLNPLGELLRSPRNAALFGLVVIVAGGLREEVQRAFLLHRFEVWLGGRTVGLIVTSAAFGAGHLLQGADAMLATGLLGAFWGAVYLRRRSIIAPMVSHTGFDLLQIAQALLAG
jgi:membrane protease YdiL (CAAX protease family)